jgi:hypothetical protein
VPGLGANYVTEKGRRDGIDGYTFYIRFVLLLIVLEELERAGFVGMGRGAGRGGREGAAGDGGYLVALPWKEGNDDLPRVVELVREEFGVGGEAGGEAGMGTGAAGQLMEILLGLARRYAEGVETSKERDDRRGAHVVGDLYGTAHECAKDDTVVKGAWAGLRSLEERVERVKKGVVGGRSRL